MRYDVLPHDCTSVFAVRPLRSCCGVLLHDFKVQVRTVIKIIHHDGFIVYVTTTGRGVCTDAIEQ